MPENVLRVSTYDFLSVTSLELQVSPLTVNSVARLAWAMFPERMEQIDPAFIPNLWVNRILIQLPNNKYGVIDANIWHDVYYYLVNFSGVEKSFYTYPKDQPFEDWFAKTVESQPEVTLDVNRPVTDIPNVVTKEYIDISNRLMIAMYVLDVFGSSPRSILQNQLTVSHNVIEPPKS